MQRKTINVLFLMVFFLAGCANKPPLPDLKTVEQTSLGFLVAGKTTRENVLLELGPAYRAYEDERILTFQLWHEKKTASWRSRKICIARTNSIWCWCSMNAASSSATSSKRAADRGPGHECHEHESHKKANFMERASDVCLVAGLRRYSGHG